MRRLPMPTEALSIALSWVRNSAGCSSVSLTPLRPRAGLISF